MASSTQLAARRSIVATLIVLLILLLLLAGLAALNVMLRQPASFQEGRESEREFLFSIYGSEGDLLRRPRGVTVTENGTIYVADTEKRRIVVFDSDGQLDGIYGNPGLGETDLWSPIDVAVAPDGRSYVVDKSQNKVVMYDVARMPIRAITFPDEPPLSVQVAEDELIITTPSGLLVGNLDGELQMGYIARGKEPGQFDMPGGVTVGEDNTLFVADSLNYRVQALGTDGAVQWTYGEPLPPEQAIQFQDETRKFGLPADIAADEMGFLYIADGTNAEIVVLDAEDGEYVETLGSVGHEDGFFYYPDSIAYANGRLVIADTFNDRVQVFRVPTPLGIFGRILPLAPWLLLPLALLLLIPLFRRRTNVVTPGFAQRMNVDARGPEVAEALKKVAAAPGLVEAFEEAFEGLSWKAIEPADDRVKALAEEHGLSEADAQALDVALHKRGRKVLLVDDAKLAQLAREYELSVVTYQDVLDSLGPAEAEAPASASSAADDAWASEDEGGKDA